MPLMNGVKILSKNQEWIIFAQILVLAGLQNMVSILIQPESWQHIHMSGIPVKELGSENNLIGQELIARWDEIRTVLIYQADIKNIQKQDFETFDVGAPYSRQKKVPSVRECEKYVLIFSDGESIDATTYSTKEEAYENMKKAYKSSYPEDLEEAWEEMSYLGDDSALLYLNGDGTCCWDIHKV